jgi:hypothetical protein
MAAIACTHLRSDTIHPIGTPNICSSKNERILTALITTQIQLLSNVGQKPHVLI